MAHFAQLDENNKVINVIVISNDDAPDPAPENSEQAGIEFIQRLAELNDSLKGKWIQTSYSGSFRNKYAKIGNIYNEEFDVFIAPQPFPSWTLDTESYYWEPPFPAPHEDGPWKWNEELQNWEKGLPIEP